VVRTFQTLWAYKKDRKEQSKFGNLAKRHENQKRNNQCSIKYLLEFVENSCFWKRQREKQKTEKLAETAVYP